MGFWFSCDYMRDMNVACDYINKNINADGRADSWVRSVSDMFAEDRMSYTEK